MKMNKKAITVHGTVLARVWVCVFIDWLWRLKRAKGSKIRAQIKVGEGREILSGGMRVAVGLWLLVAIRNSALRRKP
jgi:hypothetical protein